MFTNHSVRLAFFAGILASLVATVASAQTQFTFRDAGDEAGLFPHVAKIAGHSVAWGDIDGDGWPDLYVATFGGHPYDSKPNQLFRNVRGKFQLDDQPQLRIFGRASGCVFADFDNDGDLDLYLSNHAMDGKAYGQPHYGAPNALFRNDGSGKFTDISAASGTCPPAFTARSATVLDYDGDGLLDLLVGECFVQGGEGRSKLFRNRGDLKFDDVSRAVGLPERIVGLGVAAADVNGDGWPDIFFAGRDALKLGKDRGNRLLVNDRQGHFREVPATHADFAWEYKDTLDDTACGIAFGDVNRDGLPDLVIGQHFDRPWFTGGVPVRLYLHRGISDGWPKYEEVTASAGLIPLPMKGPHVEIQDFDNDGWPDVYVGIIKFAGSNPYPVIFKNQGVAGPVPQFREDALAVNDFPTAEDRQSGDVGAFFTRMEKEGKIVYMAPGPSADFNRDGRLDLFLANWWVNSRSLLLQNETPSGHWLDVAMTAGKGVNRLGIGTVVRLYAAGQLGQPAGLIGTREISAGYGYASGQEAIAHFGLGKLDECDVALILPHGKGRLERRGVKADQRLIVEN
jgi:hypothetical protein